MVWQVQIVNNSGGEIAAPAQSTVISSTAVIFTKFGTVTLQDIGHQPNGPHYWAVQVTSGSFSQTWWYDGQGLCTLTINGDSTFIAAGQGQTLHGKIGGPVGCMMQVPASKRVYVTGVTNAAWQQRVTLTVDGMGASSVWVGTGERNHELTNTFIDTVGHLSGWVEVGVLMEHQAPGQPWAPSSMKAGNYTLLGYNFRMVVSEDGADQDYNDSGLSLQWWQLP